LTNKSLVKKDFISWQNINLQEKSSLVFKVVFINKQHDQKLLTGDMGLLFIFDCLWFEFSNNTKVK
jgi:hypothetical protein